MLRHQHAHRALGSAPCTIFRQHCLHGDGTGGWARPSHPRLPAIRRVSFCTYVTWGQGWEISSMVGSKPPSATKATVPLTREKLWTRWPSLFHWESLGTTTCLSLLPATAGALPTSGHRGRQVSVIVGFTHVKPLITHACFPAFCCTPPACLISLPHLTHPLLVQCQEIPTCLWDSFLTEGSPMPNLTGGHLICNTATATFRTELKILMRNTRSTRFVFWELLDFCLLFLPVGRPAWNLSYKAAVKHELFCKEYAVSKPVKSITKSSDTICILEEF